MYQKERAADTCRGKCIFIGKECVHACHLPNNPVILFVDLM